MVAPILAGDGVTSTFAASSAAILSTAVPFPPDIMAPAWPIRRPGGAVRPAINEITGFGTVRVRLCRCKKSAASSSAVPPISPIKTIPKIKILKAVITFSWRIVKEKFQAIHKICSVEWIATDPNAKALTKACRCRLCDSLVSKGTRARNNTDGSLPMNVARHNANFTFTWTNNSGTIRP